MVVSLELPYPPSVNHYWRRVGARTLISRAGRAFREHVGAICLMRRQPTLAGPLSVVITINPPDHRRRDVDNVLKALLDALAYGGVYRDDSQIMRLTIEKCEPIAGGTARVDIFHFARSR